MNYQLKTQVVHIMHGEVIECLESISKHYQIVSLYSHQEVGIQKTFDRDKLVARWLSERGITWKQTPYAAVIRGAINRVGWDKHWKQVMRSPCANPEIVPATLLCAKFELFQPPQSWLTPDPNIQLGGSSHAWKCLESFFASRGQHY